MKITVKLLAAVLSLLFLRLDSTPRKFTSVTAARRFLSSAGSAVIIGLQIGHPLLPSYAYGPTDVEIKIQRFETTATFILFTTS